MIFFLSKRGASFLFESIFYKHSVLDIKTVGSLIRAAGTISSNLNLRRPWMRSKENSSVFTSNTRRNVARDREPQKTTTVAQTGPIQPRHKELVIGLICPSARTKNQPQSRSGKPAFGSISTSESD